MHYIELEVVVILLAIKPMPGSAKAIVLSRYCEHPAVCIHAPSDIRISSMYTFKVDEVAKEVDPIDLLDIDSFHRWFGWFYNSRLVVA